MQETKCKINEEIKEGKIVGNSLDKSKLKNKYDDNEVYNYRNISEQHKKIKSLDLFFVMLISSNCFETLLFYFFFNHKYPQIIIDNKTPKEKVSDIIKRYEPKYIVLEENEIPQKLW